MPFLKSTAASFAAFGRKRYNAGMIYKKGALWLALALLLCSCQYIDPLIQDANIVSVADEITAGKQMQAEVAKSMPILNDATANNMVRSIGNRLVAALPEKQFTYQFFIVSNDEPNAFTIPGATIYVHTGLLKMADQNELAGVLAHEIGHAYERHPAKSMTRQIGLAQIANASGANNSAIRQLALKIAGTGALNFYSRSDESEADRIAFDLLRKAGYPTNGLTSFLQKLLVLTKGKQTPIFLSSHPPTPDRIAALEALSRQSS